MKLVVDDNNRPTSHVIEFAIWVAEELAHLSLVLVHHHRAFMGEESSGACTLVPSVAPEAQCHMHRAELITVERLLAAT